MTLRDLVHFYEGFDNKMPIFFEMPDGTLVPITRACIDFTNTRTIAVLQHKKEV